MVLQNEYAAARQQAAWWAEASATEVLRALGSRPEGLSLSEAKRRLARFGPNVTPRVPPTPWYLHLAHNLVHFFAVMLWIAAALAWLAQTPQLAVAIVLVILINGLFGFWQEYRAERAAEALEALLPKQVVVRRENQEFVLAATEVVPGDVLVLRPGEAVAADARVFRSSNLRVDVSHLTGESRSVPRTADAAKLDHGALLTAPNLVFAGSFVTSGSGEAIVFSTGAATQFGRLAHLAQRQPQRPSPLERELQHVVRVVTVVAVSVGVACFWAAQAWGGLALGEALAFALGIIVANVPEGLLPTLTLALATAARTLAQRKALVKRLSTIEALGAATVILTDKTGTLTQNEMTACEVALVEGTFRLPRAAADSTEAIEDNFPEALRAEARHVLLRLLRCAALCCNVEFAPPRSQNERPELVGDPTEVALVRAAARVGLAMERLQDWPRLAELPFDSTRKRMTTIHRIDGNTVACSKGAWSELATHCRFARTVQALVELDPPLRSKLDQLHDTLAARGYRVLAVAERLLPKGVSEQPRREEVERDLTFLGFVALEDPPRPEVPAAIAACKRAGIRVCMVTGDDPLTASAIARQIQLHDREPLVLTGAELDGYHPAALEHLVASHRDVLFARATPEHKLRLVEAFQRLGEVVAVTGDGVNDAPALRAAEIGVAMGSTGTDVAREAADMILTDDNFASIVRAIEYGRAAFDNVRKFVTYIFASNVPEIVPFLLSVLAGIPLPLTVAQILAVDLGTDLFPALALGREPAEPGVMERPPRSRRERILSWPTLTRAYGWLGPIQAALCMLAYFYAYWLTGWRPGQPLAADGPVYATATTMTFVAIVACQVGNAFACRSVTASVWVLGWASNPSLWLAIAGELIVCLTFIYCAPLARIFGFAPLGWQHWQLVLVYPLLTLGLEEARKLLVRSAR